MPSLSKFKDILSSYRCQTCGAVFKTDEELIEHEKTHQVDQSKNQMHPEPPFRLQVFGGGNCPDCGFPYKDKSQKEAHEREHKELWESPYLVANHACFYKGGFPHLSTEMVGNLLLYNKPYKIVVRFETAEFTVPFEKIKKAKQIIKSEERSLPIAVLFSIWGFNVEQEVPYFALAYENELGEIVEGIFGVYHMQEFLDKLFQLRIEYKTTASAEL